jgi:putative oxidoreductase
MDIALVILRIVVGLLFVGHGTQKLFGWFGGSGIDGTTKMLGSLGYRPARAHALLTGVAEVGGGVLLAIGFLVPLAAAALVGVMLNAIASVHLKHGLWTTNGGLEFPLVMAAVPTAIAFAGAGVYSLDDAIGWGPSGTAWGIAAVAVGIVTGGAVFATRRVPRPPEEERAETRQPRAA